MKINLTQKERSLLQDQKSHEEICIQKYSNYAEQAQDHELSQLFSDYATQEQEHFNTITQMLNGEVPTIQNQQNQPTQQNQSPNTQFRQNSGISDSTDPDLCTDMLMTEKYVSGTYDTAIFEFTDSNARQVLNHIQTEEQQHGEGIFNFMKSRGWYNPQ